MISDTPAGLIAAGKAPSFTDSIGLALLESEMSKQLSSPAIAGQPSGLIAMGGRCSYIPQFLSIPDSVFYFTSGQ